MLLLPEQPLQVLPALAEKIGLNEAITLQQLHWLLINPKYGRRIADEDWIFNTYEQWQAAFFPFWSVMTIKRIFTNLAKMELIRSCQPEGRMSRRKYYTVDYEKLHELSEGIKLIRSKGSKRSVPITEKSSYRESKETKEDSIEDAVIFSAEWKPNTGTKEEKLKRIKPPADYPSEQEFDSFINSESLDGILAYRPDLYSTLCDQRWHQWKSDLAKWVRIRDWRRYVKSLDELLLTR